MNPFEKIDRKNTKSMKYDSFEYNHIPEDALPMWVADMDFKTTPEVIEALHNGVEHGIFGYSGPDESYFKAVLNWVKKHYGLDYEYEDIVLTPGVVFALAHAVRAFTDKGDAVLIQTPVYHPFHSVVKQNDRKLVTSSLVEENGHYSIDFEDFEAKIRDNDVKLFILCNPHNPVGRVFTEEELKKMLEICKKYGVQVVSDEIHADFIFGENKHTSLPTLDEDVILMTAPSKTFNLAGLQLSNIFIKNKDKREKFRAELAKSGAGLVSPLAMIACETAYRDGEAYLAELKEILEENFELVKEYLDKNVKEIKTVIPEGTYLMWLDCRDLGLDDKALASFFLEEAKLWLDQGNIFGEEGSGYMRLNVAAPKETILEALERLEKAVNQRKENHE